MQKKKLSQSKKKSARSVVIPVGRCECGCGQVVTQKRRDYVPRFILGHYQSARKGIHLKPETTSLITARAWAREVIDASKCGMAHLGHCIGRIEVHHRDKNPFNNSVENLFPVCRTHHKLLDSGNLRESDKKMPEYRSVNGKRKYAHQIVSKRKVGVWLTAEDEELLKSMAKKEGLCVSDFIKLRCLGA